MFVRVDIKIEMLTTGTNPAPDTAMVEWIELASSVTETGDGNGNRRICTVHVAPISGHRLAEAAGFLRIITFFGLKARWKRRLNV